VTVWLNKVFLGYGQDSCLPSEFDISHIVANFVGSNSIEVAIFELVVMVTRWCDGSYIEDQDKWWLSGIYRDVYIIRKSPLHIMDYEIVADMIETCTLASSNSESEPRGGKCSTQASISVTVSVDGVNNGSDSFVRTEIWAPIVDGSDTSAPALVLLGCIKAYDKELFKEFYLDNCNTYASEVSAIVPEHPGRAVFTDVLDKPILWTAETPYLYIAVITLHATSEDASTGAHAIDTEACRIGIRSVSVETNDNVLCVNGQPLMIAGVNRHEFQPETGRTLTDDAMRRDAELMKQFNFNAVRNSHYPPHHRWLEICDELGLYVVDEANIESHGFQTLGQPVGYLSHQSDWRSALFTRVTRMFERDKNYPSIIAWSLGNESGIGPTHYEMADWLRFRDPRRVVQVYITFKI
jgi:beta-galactosidase